MKQEIIKSELEVNDNKIKVIEYSEMSEEMKNKKKY